MLLKNSLPVNLNERSDILDILRGFALFGIFANNVTAFSGYAYISQEIKTGFDTYSIDYWVMAFQTLFVQGKFYSLFSLLFGIGFSIILIRNEQKGVNGLKIFYRRIFILLLIGALHLRFFWEGDILFLYALIGMVLPLFRKCSDRTLLTWAICLILSPILIDLVRIATQWNPGDFLLAVGQKTDVANGVPVDESFAFYLFKEDSGMKELLNWNESGFFYRYQYILDSNRILKVLGIFLIGFYAGRRMIYVNLEEHRNLLLKLRNWGWMIGLPFSVAMVYFEMDKYHVPRNWMAMTDTICYALSVVPLSLAYAAMICLWYIKNKEKSPLRGLAPMGRMALTNYISQTVLGILIFYNLGLGLGTTIGYGYIFLIALGVGLVQLLLSKFWMKYFNYGPLEWIWRQLTYGKRLKLRKG